MNYRAIRRTKEEYLLRKRNSHGEKALKELNKKLLGKRDGPDPRPERRTLDNHRCAEEKPMTICEYARPLPEAPVDE